MPLQYPASKFAVKVLRILAAKPGATATEIAGAVWNNTTGRFPLNAGIALHRLCKHKLIFPDFASNFWEEGSPFPRKHWYLTEKGFAVYTYYERQREANSPHADGARRTRC